MITIPDAVGLGQPSLAAALAQRQPLPTVTPIIGTEFLVIVFFIVALVRFEHEEFREGEMTVQRGLGLLAARRTADLVGQPQLPPRPAAGCLIQQGVGENGSATDLYSCPFN